MRVHRVSHTHEVTPSLNPFLFCRVCGDHVTGRHDHTQCGCTNPDLNWPCFHAAAPVSTCPTWTPEDHCTCPRSCYDWITP